MLNSDAWSNPAIDCTRWNDSDTLASNILPRTADWRLFRNPN